MRSVRISSISRAVEEVARTFRRHLRVIVEDDRRRQHQVLAAPPRRPGPARRRRCGRRPPPRATPPAGPAARRIAVADAKDGVRRNQRPQQGVVAARRPASANGVRFRTRTVSRNSPSPAVGGADLDCPLERSAARVQDADRPRRPRRATAPAAGRPANANVAAMRPLEEFRDRQAAQRDLALLRLLPRVEIAYRRPAASPRDGTPARRPPAIPSGAARTPRRRGPSGAGSGRPPRRSRPRRRGPGTPSGCAQASAPPPRPAVRLGVQAAEGPALAVLHRRAIGIENVSLVQHGVGDAVHECAVHGVDRLSRPTAAVPAPAPRSAAPAGSCTATADRTRPCAGRARRCSDNNGPSSPCHVAAGRR